MVEIVALTLKLRVHLDWGLKYPDRVNRNARSPAISGANGGEVTVVERLRGLTSLYVQLAPKNLVVVQAKGDSSVRVHDRVSIANDLIVCQTSNIVFRG